MLKKSEDLNAPNQKLPLLQEIVQEVLVFHEMDQDISLFHEMDQDEMCLCYGNMDRDVKEFVQYVPLLRENLIPSLSMPWEKVFWGILSFLAFCPLTGGAWAEVDGA